MLAINEVLQQGRYRITHRFGQDAAGAGYEAFDTILETNVLLKEIPVRLKKVTNAAQQETFKLAFADEAKILKQIKHESLLHVRDYFSEVDRQFLVLESVDGKVLSELIEKSKKPFTLPVAANWADQLLDALHYLHTRTAPIIHRDIKPQNIKLTASGKIKLLAFGIAKTPDANVNAADTNQTIDHTALHYSSLEQIWGGLDRASQNVIANSYDEKSEKILNQPADARSDIYALGATLYYLLTARLPVDALERSIDILEGKPDPLPTPHQLNPSVPPEVSEVLMKALEIKRENRFDSAIIMRQVLRTAVVRVKEREAQEAKKQEVVLEIPSTENKSLEQKRRVDEQKRLEIEAEQKRQTELIKQKLRESEARRLRAEQRAAEAEKRLLEKETEKSGGRESLDLNTDESLKSGDKKSLAAAINSPKVFKQASIPAAIIPEPTKQSVAPENSSDEFKDMFAQPQKDNKIRRRMSVGVLVLLMFGGAFFGIRYYQLFRTAEPIQIVLEQPTSPVETAIAEPTVETAPAPIIEATPETSAMPTPSETPDFVETPSLTETPVSRPPLRNKTAPPLAPRVEKQIPPPPKTQPKKQKAITVDDLINDN